MRLEFDGVAEQDPEGGLCVVIEKDWPIYGSLMNISLQLRGDSQTYHLMPCDLTTRLIVRLPAALVDRLSIRSGDMLCGEIGIKEYEELTLPSDVALALDKLDLDIRSLSLRQQRQGLLFIREAGDAEIRKSRIIKFVEACQQAASGCNRDRP